MATEVIAQQKAATTGAEETLTEKAKKETNAEAKKTTNKKPKKRPPFQWVNPPAKKFADLVQHETFTSPSMGHEVGYNVYLPPSYQESSARYPVVFYLHGGRPGSESKSLGLVQMIDQTIRELGKPGAIYVFVNGGPVSHYNMPGDPAAQGASIFIDELIPHIETTYRTLANRQHRGIEGFSQGGRGAMRLSLRHPDLFLSSAPGGGGYETERKISESGGYESEKLKFAQGDNVYDLAKDYAARRNQGSAAEIKLLLHVGTKGFNYENNLAYMEYLDTLAIPYAKVIVPDAPHSASKIYQEVAGQLVDFHLTNFGQ